MSTERRAREELIIPVRPGITKLLSLPGNNSRVAFHICKRVKVTLFIALSVSSMHFGLCVCPCQDGRMRKLAGVGEDVDHSHSTCCQRSYRLPILFLTDPQVEPTQKDDKCYTPTRVYRFQFPLPLIEIT